MKQRAQRVWRWVERMNAPVLDASEYGDCSEELFAGDAVPDTLRALLAYIGDEYLDEAVAQVAAVDAWLAEHPEAVDGEVVLGKPKRRFSGTTTFSWRGRDMTVAVVPYRLFLVKRVQDAFGAATPGEQATIRPCSPRPGSTRCSTSGHDAGWSGPTTARCGAPPRSRCSPPDGRRRPLTPRWRCRRSTRRCARYRSNRLTNSSVWSVDQATARPPARSATRPAWAAHPGVDDTVEPETHETVEPHVQRHHRGLGEGRSRPDQPRPVVRADPPARPGPRSSAADESGDALRSGAVVDADHRREHVGVDPGHRVAHALPAPPRSDGSRGGRATRSSSHSRIGSESARYSLPTRTIGISRRGECSTNSSGTT